MEAGFYTHQQAGAQAEEVSQAFKRLKGSCTSFEVVGRKETALAFVVLLNPLSKTAQQLSNTLDFMRRTLGPKIKVYLFAFIISPLLLF